MSPDLFNMPLYGGIVLVSCYQPSLSALLFTPNHNAQDTLCFFISIPQFLEFPQLEHIFFFFLANSYLLFKLVSSSSKAFLGIYTPLYSVPFLWAPNASSSICDCCPRHVFLALSPVNVSVLDLLDFKVFEEKKHSTHRRYIEGTQIAATVTSPNPPQSLIHK